MEETGKRHQSCIANSCFVGYNNISFCVEKWLMDIKHVCVCHRRWRPANEAAALYNCFRSLLIASLVTAPSLLTLEILGEIIIRRRVCPWCQTPRVVASKSAGDFIVNVDIVWRVISPPSLLQKKKKSIVFLPRSEPQGPMHHQSAPLNPVLMKPKSLVPSRRRFQDTDWPLARLNEIYFIYNIYIYQKQYRRNVFPRQSTSLSLVRFDPDSSSNSSAFHIRKAHSDGLLLPRGGGQVLLLTDRTRTLLQLLLIQQMEEEEEKKK